MKKTRSRKSRDTVPLTLNSRITDTSFNLLLCFEENFCTYIQFFLHFCENGKMLTFGKGYRKIAAILTKLKKTWNKMKEIDSIEVFKICANMSGLAKYMLC
jgi:hypothetical protein